MKNRRRYPGGCLIAFLVLVLFLAGGFMFLVVGGFVDYRLETYEAWHGVQAAWAQKREGRSCPMPSLDELKDATEIRFQKYKGCFWGEEAYILIAQYDEDQYETAKRRLKETLVFETQAIDQGKQYEMIEPAFTMGGFNVRLLKTGNLPYASEVPKEMYFAGTCEESCEILYICYDDPDLDSLSSLEKEVPKLIRWRCVKWLERMPFLRHFFLPVIG